MTLPVLVAVMVAATVVGIGAERHWHGGAERASRSALGAMLRWVLPPVYLVLVSRVHVDAALLGGLATGYAVIAAVGGLAWLGATRLLRLPRRTVGAVILAVIVTNTGYFGLPLIRAVLGSDELGPAVAWDSLVAGPMFFVAAFAVGAAFGTAGPGGGGARVGSGGPGGAVGSGDDGGWEEESDREEEGDQEEESESRLGAFLRNPLLWGAVAGLLLPWDAPSWAASIAQDVVVALLPVGFVVVGVQLSAQNEGGSILRGPDGRIISPEIGLVLVLRLVVAPLLVLGASVAALDLPHGMLIQAAAPSGLNGMLVAHRFGLDLRPVAGAIVWTTAIMTLGVVVVTAVG